MKAIVTGGAGFIGSHLSKALLQSGWDVFVVDNLSSGYERNIPNEASFELIDLSLEKNIDKLPKENIDVVFHLASHVGQELSFEKPIYDFKANALSTLLLLQWCKKYSVNKFIFASSMNVYGNPPQERVDENTPISPPSPYSVGKIASEYFCNIYQRLGINCTSLRLFNVFGPNQDLDNLKQGMVSIFLSYVINNKAIDVRGSKERFRDFISVHDVVNAFIKCVDSKANGNIYNVSTGIKTHVWELIDKILQACNESPDSYPVNYLEGTIMDQFGIYGDSSKLARDLSWEPNVALKDGLIEMVKWAKSINNNQKVK